jgi:histidine triad (HIT) family protein
MASIFSRIVAGEIPCHKVWEDQQHLAFLDINPWVEGHTLVIPKVEHDYLFDMSDDAYARLHLAAKKVANLLKDKLGCKRVCTMVIGYEVPHVHIHLLPTNHITEFANPSEFQMKVKPDLAALAKRLNS